MNMDTTRNLTEAEASRCAAMLANDLSGLDELIDPDLHFSHANGAVDDKSQYLAKMAAGRIVYRSIDWSEQKTTQLGDVGMMTGRMTSVVAVEGQEKRLDNRVLSIWRQTGTWRLLAFQSTPLPD